MKWHIISALIMTLSLYAMDEKQPLIKKTASKQSVDTDKSLGCIKKMHSFLDKPIYFNSRKSTGIAYFLTGLTGMSTMVGGIFSIGSMPLPVSVVMVTLGMASSAFFCAGSIQHCCRPSEEDDSSDSESDSV